MGWTEERVELLKKLWADGLSASQIAGRLGGITRNAVIGKVHRLGLAGRATTSRIRAPRLRHRAAQPTPIRPAAAPTLPRVQFRTVGNAALKPVYAPVEQKMVALTLVPSPVEEAAPKVVGVHLLDLKEDMCRWPTGDPKDENFHFCGCQKTNGAYCEHHARIAYQPTGGATGKTSTIGSISRASCGQRRLRHRGTKFRTGRKQTHQTRQTHPCNDMAIVFPAPVAAGVTYVMREKE